MKIVFLVEEQSMRYLLEGILPKVLPIEIDFQVIPHQGKQNLGKSIPIKLRSWKEPNVRFVVIQDQDSWDCVELKQIIQTVCKESNRPETLVRIACHEMEAWYFGDLRAVGLAYNMDLKRLSGKRKYRDPDAIENPKTEIKKIVKELQQIEGARKISKYMNIQANSSHSFKVFVSGVLKVSKEMLES